MCVKRTRLPGPLMALITVLSLLAPASASAQPMASDYPNRPVHIVVGFTPGGAPDITARVLAQKLSDLWKQPVIVENKPGAGSALAAHAVSTATPDGYTLLSVTTAHAVVPAINAQLPYDTLKDFAPVTMTSIAPNWVLVAPSLGVTSIKDFIALARAKPGQLNYGSAGVGSFMHFAAAMFNDAVGIQAQHVPYRGPPEALADTVSGRVQYVVSPIGAALGLVRGGKLVPLAVTGKSRLAEFPDVPTMAESGYPGFELLTWTGILAPARTPPAVIAKINQAIGELLKQPDVKTRWDAISVDPVATTPAEFQTTIADAVAEFTAAARKAGISEK